VALQEALTNLQKKQGFKRESAPKVNGFLSQKRVKNPLQEGSVFVL